MATTGGGLALGGDVEQALTGIPVPSYVLDTDGVVRWINPAAERLLGDVRGRHFTSVVGAEDRTRARELFARKVLGTTVGDRGDRRPGLDRWNASRARRQRRCR